MGRQKPLSGQRDLDIAVTRAWSTMPSGPKDVSSGNTFTGRKQTPRRQRIRSSLKPISRHIANSQMPWRIVFPYLGCSLLALKPCPLSMFAINFMIATTDPRCSRNFGNAATFVVRRWKYLITTVAQTQFRGVTFLK